MTSFRRRVLLLLVAVAAPVSASIAAEPTEYEQYLLELVNRARANPNGEVTRTDTEKKTQPGYWGSYTGFNSYDGFERAASLNEGPPILGGAPYTIGSAAKQPLAFNSSLMDTARAYVARMQATNSIGHRIDGTSSDQRMRAQGYSPGFAFGAGQNNYFPGWENNAFVATSDSFDFGGYNGDIRAEAIDLAHHGLFTDYGVASRGHRMTMMAPDWREAGIALDFGFDPGFSSLYANHLFSYEEDRDQPFITGVVYNDLDGDGFYTPEAGEAIGGVQVSVYRAGTQTSVASTTAFASGGYGVIVPAGGTYDVHFVSTADNVDHLISDIRVDTANVKVDAIDPGSAGTPPTDFFVSSIIVRGDHVVISWPSVAGTVYRVLTSTDQSNWKVIDGSEAPANGASSSYTHNNGAYQVTRRFYRVEQL